MAEDEGKEDRDESRPPSAERDEHKQARRPEKDGEGRDTPPSDRGRDPKSPWLGGG
jgi:hypothetical protein